MNWKQHGPKWLLFFLLFLLGMALSFKSIREPDLWWMYRTGEWIWENGAVTYSDPFSYTQEGRDWINVKWLFEVIIVAFKKMGGPEMVFVLQALISLGLMYFSAASARLLAPKRHGLSMAWAFAIGLPILLFGLDFRLIGRPEMSSHLLVAVYLFLFLRQSQKAEHNGIFWLIPLQLLWTNLHEAFGIGMVLMFAVLGSSWAQYFLMGKKTAPPKKQTLAILGALLVIPINPRGISMWAHPFNIFGQLQNNKYTSELNSYLEASYWMKEAYVNLFFLGAALLFLGLVLFGSKEGRPKLGQLLAWPNLVLPALLFYLSLTAYRNIPFFLLASAPFLLALLERLLRPLVQKSWKMALSLGLALSLASCYGLIVSGNYHKWIDSRDQFGLQVLNSHNPIKAAEFMAQENINGRGFADYLSSAYLLWRLQPDFKTYIDLRDLDIFPADFFAQYEKLLQNPALFDAEDQKYNFEYVVLLRRPIEQIPTLYVHLHDSPNYVLVYADPVAMVYVKRLPKYEQLIAKKGLTKTAKKAVFEAWGSSTSSAVPLVLTKMLYPFFENEENPEVNQWAIGAHLYYALDEQELAQKALEKALQHPDKAMAYSVQGRLAARQYLDPKSSAEQKAQAFKTGKMAFEQALALAPENLESLFGIGVLLAEEKQYAAAIQYFQAAKKLAPENPAITGRLNACYQALGQ
ncbi:cytochrome c biogenesis factor [Saprospira grandis DSM 2844]|uniref:Cytochrome c biogenesis factor n=1 Tax=Saprospira grandis DSM 2844 TaxID=694433 RepID=J1I4D2_9BACT|nr:hypothetical protein [Saprospira grandis]EJF53198.1 cytochrome c biogenesis factor [Saprospira grandis DSM 2844]